MSGGPLTSVHRYLDLRGISNGEGPVIWPSSYGPAERDEAYKSFSLFGWGGDSGHDAPMIVLDALLGAGSDWKELMNRAAFHGGQRFKKMSFWAFLWSLKADRVVTLSFIPPNLHQISNIKYFQLCT